MLDQDMGFLGNSGCAHCVKLVSPGMSTIRSFECPALQQIREQHHGLFGGHAGTVAQSETVSLARGQSWGCNSYPTIFKFIA